VRLTKVITPELVLGTRGDEWSLDIYKQALSSISAVGPGIFAGQNIQNLDQVMQSHFAMAWKFKKERPRVYHVGKDFTQAMSQIDRDIPIDRLPERFFAYISFPEKTLYPEDGPNEEVRGAFIFIGPAKETFGPQEIDKEKVVWISVDMDAPPDIKNKSHEGFLNLRSFLMNIDKSITHTLQTAPDLDDEHGRIETTTDRRVLRTLINLAIYIHSAEPELLPTRAVQDHSNSDRKRFFEKHGVANHCTVPVTMISWNWQKPRIYNVDSTLVESYYRWQRCGPGFSQVKLILVNAHERHYKKGVENDQGSRDSSKND
jgi:hypothetical protein